MALSRIDVLTEAVDILNQYGLGDLTMRRLASALSVRASALYWHFANKQELLAAVADRILADVEVPQETTRWDAALHSWGMSLHQVLLGYRDGAELVASALALNPGHLRPHEGLADRLSAAGLTPEAAETVAVIVRQQVIGLALHQQSLAQAVELGVMKGPVPDDSDQVLLALELIADGTRGHFGI